MKRRTQSRATSFRIVIRDALCGVMAEDVADAVLDAALRRARLTRVPADVEEVAAFAGGSVREEIEGRLGAPAAEAVAAALEPVLAAARSGVQRRRSAPKQPAAGVPLARVAVRRRVVLLCQDPSTQAAVVQSLLAPKVSLDLPVTPAELALLVERGSIALLVLVLPGFDPEEVARILVRAPPPAAVVIRGGGSRALGLAGTLRARSIRCTILPAETSSEQLAETCRLLLSPA